MSSGGKARLKMSLNISMEVGLKSKTKTSYVLGTKNHAGTSSCVLWGRISTQKEVDDSDRGVN